MTEKECRDALLRFFANPQNDKRDCMIFSELIREYFKLVEKETPKMPDDISSGHIPKHGKCPNCGNFVVQTCSHDRCSMCGQMLKWEEEE